MVGSCVVVDFISVKSMGLEMKWMLIMPDKSLTTSEHGWASRHFDYVEFCVDSFVL